MPSLFAGDDGETDAEPYRDDPLASPPPGAGSPAADKTNADAADQMPPPAGSVEPVVEHHGLRRRACLLLPPLLLLLALTDTRAAGNDGGGDGRARRHLAFVTALVRHPPSMRVFRLVFEGCFALYCAAAALRVWEGPGGRGWRDEAGGPGGRRGQGHGEGAGITPEAVGRLLFAPVPDAVGGNAAYAAVRRRRERRRGRRGGERAEADGASVGPDDGRGGDDGEDEDDLSSIREKTATSHPRPPSSASVLSTALHESTVLCCALVLFTVSSSEGGRYLDATPGADPATWTAAGLVARVAAPAFPLALFARAAYRLLSPWDRRRDLWAVLGITAGAPLYDVTFRDGLVGDVLTSAVRPLQDLAYTAFFLPAGLDAWRVGGLYSPEFGKGGATEAFDDAAASVPPERDWALHTLILPACAMSPMWWRYLQNLRRCHDARRRWPHLGNAAKYLVAAEVACLASFDPGVRSNPAWVACFVAATAYQVWWDVFQDWGLVEWDALEGGFRLRRTRLYGRGRDRAYVAAAAVNALLRFVGMVTLIPPVYLSRATGLVVSGRGGPGVRMAAETAAACAELFRRTVWAVLRVEWEVIRTDGEAASVNVGGGQEEDGDGPAGGGTGFDALGMEPMSIEISGDRRGRRPVSAIGARKWEGALESLSDMSDLDGVQVLGELCVWATVFSGLAVVAAAHREVL